MSVKRINAGPRMSSAVVHGDTVYLAGLTADDAKADVKGQTKQILDKIDKFLKEAGTDKSKILSANIWLTDMAAHPYEVLAARAPPVYHGRQVSPAPYRVP